MDLVPEEAIEAACLAMNDGVWSSRHRERWEPQVMTVLSAAAPLILAAELERWVERLGGTLPGGARDRMAQALRIRVAELRGE